jgi:hypothetical protein
MSGTVAPKSLHIFVAISIVPSFVPNVLQKSIYEKRRATQNKRRFL